MAKEQVMCSEHPKTPLLCPTCDKDQIDSLAASEVVRQQVQAPKVIRLSDVTRNASGHLDMASIPGDQLVPMEVVRAFDAQRIALSEVAAAIGKGQIAPAKRAAYEKIALSDIGSFRSVIEGLQEVDLRERGHGHEGTGLSELATIDAKFDVDAKARAKADGIQYHEAVKLVASENAEMNIRRTQLMRASIGKGDND